MIGSLVDIIWTAIENGFVFLDNLFTSFGLSYVELALGFGILTAVFKYILSPYLSGSGSDSAKKQKRKGSG